MAADLGWMALQWPGMEHVIVSDEVSGITAAGHVVLANTGLVTVAYRLTCDAGWHFRRLTIDVAGAGHSLTLANEEEGWLANGVPRPDLAGCIDIDINCTPLTNTLPIRRLDWSGGATHDIDVAYLSVPELEVRKVRQRYTRLDPGRFRYESGSFRRDLSVDDSGFVLDYPGFWRRLCAEVAR
ncbi:MAG TPA: putative glycolipid-binding domain-containing protein [Streptosporangiaceae bacterium]|nr:putative glycolipid-binding domain-containing protein [Streptosporangiaceae bacterium]